VVGDPQARVRVGRLVALDHLDARDANVPVAGAERLREPRGVDLVGRRRQAFHAVARSLPTPECRVSPPGRASLASAARASHPALAR